MSEGDLSKNAERFADKNPDVSLREFLTRIYIRPKTFWTCVIVPPLFAIFLTFLVPATWTATVQILIRYSSDESAFLQGLIPSHREILSGQTNAEILQSIPTLVATIRQQHITANDIYQKPTDVLTGYVSGFIAQYFPSSMPPGLPGISPKTLILAQMFKNSLSNAKQGFLGSASTKDKVQVLQSASNIPTSLKTDDLITVTVPSFNRNKVAQMANGLAQAFITEYYRISAADATRSYNFLSKMVVQAEHNYHAFESGQSSSLLIAAGPDNSGVVHVSQKNPLLENLSKKLADTQTRLAKAQQIYIPNSPRVIRLTAQVTQLQRLLKRETQIATAKQVLEQLKVRRYQAYNTIQMYKNKLIPINIVEPAFTPKKQISKQLLRYIVSGTIGLVLGTVLGLCLTIIFSITDPRLYTSWDIERFIKLPTVGSLPALGKPPDQPATLTPALAKEPALANGLLQIIGYLDNAAEPMPGKIITITSATTGEGKSFASLALAGALAQGGRFKVLLVDASLQNQQLTKSLMTQTQPGFIESVLTTSDMAKNIVPMTQHSIDFIPSGNSARRGELGIYSAYLNTQFKALRAIYNFVVVDTTGILSGNEATICSIGADNTLLVVSTGISRKPLIRKALTKLGDVGAGPDGVIHNRQKQILPAIIYNNV
ncbi:MAG: AAA family ATPase [Acidiferrobacteraceae bacterium]